MRITPTVQGTRALAAAAVVLAVWLVISIAALAGLLPEQANQTWEEIVANTQDAISHE